MRGVRFAPSPTGSFHIGNFRTAWISHELARKREEPWIVRFEDIDQPRVVPGAQESQLQQMATLGMVPDRVLLQTSNRMRHWELFVRAIREGRVYPCYCSRKDLRAAVEGVASAPHVDVQLEVSPAAKCELPVVYSGKCRSLSKTPSHDLPTIGWRFKVLDETADFDFIIARTSPVLDAQGLPEEGSFVPGYAWACAIDDFDGDYSLLVRAWDLAHAAAQQRAIQRWVAETENKKLSLPAIYHTALVTRGSGARLEKRTHGVTLPELMRRGLTVEGILSRFKASFFYPVTAIQAGENTGEDKKALRLSDLGLEDH